MNTLTIENLPVTEELSSQALARIRGGIYRTPVQILAHELTGLPATPDGRVLGQDGQLYFPGFQPGPRVGG